MIKRISNVKISSARRSPCCGGCKYVSYNMCLLARTRRPNPHIPAGVDTHAFGACCEKSGYASCSRKLPDLKIASRCGGCKYPCSIGARNINNHPNACIVWIYYFKLSAFYSYRAKQKRSGLGNPHPLRIVSPKRQRMVGRVGDRTVGSADGDVSSAERGDLGFQLSNGCALGDAALLHDHFVRFSDCRGVW